MLARSLVVLAIATTAAADPEPKTTLVGKAAFSVQPTTDHGSVRLIVRGLGDIGDACADANTRQFVAEYDGALAIAPDDSFTAPLLPTTITTPSGCAISELTVEHVTGIAIDAKLGELTGHGALTFQTLAGIDANDLFGGAFDELVARLVFAPEAPCNCAT